MITSYFMVFLTDVVGLAPSIVGTIFLVAMLFDAINDPLIGSITDRTRTFYGTFRPWMMGAAIPYVIVTILCFVKIPASTTVKIIWYLVMYCLFTVLETMYAMPLVELLFVPKLIGMIGNKAMFYISAIFAILSGVCGLIAQTNTPMVIAAYVFSGLTLAGVYANIWGCMPNCADYGEWKTGIAAAGLICSGATFAMKVGGAFASYGSGWLLTFAGYDATLEVQSAYTMNFIYLANGVLPIVCGIVAIILIAPFNLDRALVEKVRVELEARRSGK